MLLCSVLVHVLTKKILDGDVFPDFSIYHQPLLTSYPFPLLPPIQSQIAFAQEFYDDIQMILDCFPSLRDGLGM